MSWVSIVFLILVFGMPVLQKILKAYSDWQKNSGLRDRQDYDDRPSMDSADDNIRIQAVDPSQMTMAERIELARQRARQQGGGPAQAEREAQIRAQRDEQARALRQQQEQADRQRQQQAAAREQARRRQQLEQARRQQAGTQQRPGSTSGGSTSASTARSTGSVPVAKVVRRPDQRRAQRRAAATSQQKSDAGKIASTGLSLTGNAAAGNRRRKAGHSGAHILRGVSLKRAMILKEVLDPPLALRQESSQPWA